IEAVLLAGLGTAPEGLPQAIALVWAEQETGWFPAWSLQLHSDAGLLRPEAAPRPAPSRRLGTTHVNVAALSPQWGHTYRTQLSYYPQRGGLSVTVADLTTGASVLREQYLLAPFDAPLYPGVGTL